MELGVIGKVEEALTAAIRSSNFSTQAKANINNPTSRL